MVSSPVKRKFVKETYAVLAPYSLGYRIKLLSQLSARRFQEQLETFSLTPFHWVVLCCLWQEDGSTTGSIREKLQQVGGTITGVLDRMEERGLIRRERDLQDRRVSRIWLTPAGKQLQNVLPLIALEHLERALKGIPDAERELLSEMLDQLISNVSV